MNFSSDSTAVRCEEAVLLLGFNRPHLLRELIDNLRFVRPSKIYVAIDGPRADRPDDAEAVHECRKVIDRIDWSADVHTRFADTNLGCGTAVSSAIDWFLSHEERGIVLEDDVLPHPTFFEYCTRMLDRYVDDERVLTVNGHNLVPSRGQSRPDLPYRFARYTEMWGWALWRRTWKDYSLDISDWKTRLPPEQLWDATKRSLGRALFWSVMFDVVATGGMNTWDIPLELMALCSDQVMAVPNVNLTENIGFGPNATHFTHTPPTIQPVGTMRFPMESVEVVSDDLADQWIHRHHFQVELRIHQVLQRRTPGFQEYVGAIRELHRGR